MEKRIDSLEEDVKDIDLRLTRLETQLSTAISLVKWFLSPGMAFLIILQLAKLANLI